MIHRSLTCAVLALCSASWLMADFSYEQSSKITGGMMAGMMKVAGVFSKSAREPIRTTIAVKGDRMVTVSGQTAQVIDLSKETWTDIDFQKKQYSVMTFAEFAQMMEEVARSMKKEKAEVKFDFKFSVDPTGQTRNINGLDAKQAIVKMVMEGQNEKGEKVPGMVVTSDMWLAPKIPGYEELVQFQVRMAQKLAWAPGGGMVGMMGGPEASKAFRQLYTEGSKLDGVPILQTVKMGVDVPAGAEGAEGAQQAPPPQQEQQQAQAPSAGGVLGGALGGRLGGLGGLGRRKQQQPPAQQPEPQQQAGGQPQQGGPGSLMEMTIETTGFSSGAVDASKFEVPAGFRQVKPEKRMR
jgi:hypothetical protein